MNKWKIDYMFFIPVLMTGLSLFWWHQLTDVRWHGTDS